MGLQDQVVRYFTEEKVESAVFVLVGVAAIAVSVWLWRTGSSYRGMAYPLVAMALIQLVVGGTVFLRTEGQVAALADLFAERRGDIYLEQVRAMPPGASAAAALSVSEEAR